MIVFEYCNATLTRLMLFPKWLWILRYVIGVLATISGIMSEYWCSRILVLNIILVLTAAFVAPNQLDEAFWTNMTDGWEWALGRFDLFYFSFEVKL